MVPSTGQSSRNGSPRARIFSTTIYGAPSRNSDKPLPQPLAILARLRESVDVIDPHAVDHALRVEPENQRMHRIEHFGPFDAHRGQRADVEEAPPVHFIGSGAPPREPDVLTFDQAVQAVARRRVFGRVRLQHDIERRAAVLLDEIAQRLARRRGARLIGGLRGEAAKAFASAFRSARSADCRIDA